MATYTQLIGGLILSFVLSSAVAAQEGPPPAAVRTDAVRMESVQEQRLVTGELRAVQRSRVAAEEEGLVTDIPVEQGQSVQAGATLAQLDRSRLEIELQELEASQLVAEAEIEEREADLAWRSRDLENYESLAAGGAGKAKELYDAQMRVRIARARLESSRRNAQVISSRAALLKTRLEDMTIVAPFDGVIVTKHVEQGEWLAAGAPVVEMIATATIDAWLDVPQQFAGALLGSASSPVVTINIEASGEQIETTTVRTVPLVDPKARTFSVIARLDNADQRLAPGMSITAFVPTGALADRLTVPRDAVIRGPTGTFVYVARTGRPDAPAAAMPADIQVLFGAGPRFVVNAPSLQPGDMLVVEGNERLFPTAPIIPQPVEGAEPSSGETSRN